MLQAGRGEWRADLFRRRGGAAAREVGQGSALDPTLEAAPPDLHKLFYGLRVIASIALAMWVAFWLQLDNPFWAPVTAAVVCQPSVGASLRKGQFRIIGTMTGALAIVLLTAAMPQSRIGMLAAVTVWGGLAGFAATLLRNNAAYAASLAGYTAIIVFTDTVSTTPDQAFTLAITRATEISIGVLSAGFVLALTDAGDARRRLCRTVAAVINETASGLDDTLAMRTDADAARTRRRALIGRIAALDPLTDEVMGESAELRYRSSTLQRGLEGLFETIAAWRGIAEHLELAQADHVAAQAKAVAAIAPLGALDWTAPARARQTLLDAAHIVTALTVENASERLLADRAAEAMRGLARGANALALLQSARTAARERDRAQIYIPDLLPALINACRVMAAMIVAEAIWIETAWPGGEGALVFAAIVTILFGPQSERAPGIVRQFAAGVVIASILASIVQFAVLPGQQTFAALILAIGVVVVPNAMLAAGDWQKSLFTGISFIFVSLLAPTNLASFDVAGYFNNSLTIVVGVVIAVAAFRLIPPMAGATRARRLLGLTLRDLRLLAAGRARRTRRTWLGLLTARLSTMPDAGRLPQARLVAAISAGAAIIWLHENLEALAGRDAFGRAMADIAAGRLAPAQASLTLFARSQSSTPVALRAEGEALLLRDVLARHGDYFAS